VGDLSAHFSSHEFVDSVTGELGADVDHLVEHLEVLRSICGNRPLRILSGWRSTATNAAVGGAPGSQHLLGRAADIPAGHATLSQALRAGFRGVGLQGRWAVHVDVRRGPPATWSY